MKLNNNDLKVWVEIDQKAIRSNIKVFRKLLTPKTKLWSVVKSNAYGHGIFDFTREAKKAGVDGFCVDSVIEGLKLRKQGITGSILVLGPTLPGLLKRAKEAKLTLTLSSKEMIERFAKAKDMPDVHLKVDTGMRRQGVYLRGLKSLLLVIKRANVPLKGIYTHFASSKDLNYPTFTDLQFHEFKKAVKVARDVGFKNLIRHVSATGATLISDEYHLDAVRVGIGIYGLWPSRELEAQRRREISLTPVLSWKAMVSEVKHASKGDYVGYDLTERLTKATQVAIIPIGYWHGFDRKLSSNGSVIIRNRRARVLGRVSMDLIAVDAGREPVKAGDTAVLIGRKGTENIPASEMADLVGTTHYEIITRINPLIQRVVK